MLPPEVNAKLRVRDRILARLDELGMTGREFAKRVGGYKDGWFNAIKKGRNALALADLDSAAAVLKTTPGELVRRGEEGWDLRPSEARMIRAMRLLPPVIQDDLIQLTEYLVGVSPDEVEMLNEYRELTTGQQSLVRHWIHVMPLAGELEPERALPADLPQTTAAPPGLHRSTRRKR